MGTSADGYQQVEYGVPLSPGGPEFRLLAQIRDITKPGADATTWHVLEGAASFLVTVTGRTGATFDHPMPATEALTIAMLLAVRDTVDVILRSAGKLDDGKDYPVTVTQEHLAEGEVQAARMAAQARSSS